MPRMTQIQGDWSKNESECCEVVLSALQCILGEWHISGILLLSLALRCCH